MASRMVARAVAVLLLLVGFCVARPLAALAESDVIRELSAAAANSGLREREISRVIRRGLTAGERYPRQVPDRTRSSQ